MRIVNVKQQTQEWHDVRRNHLGASEAASCMRIDPYRTTLQLWKEKQGIIPPKTVTWQMQKGIDLEPEARQKFCQMVGVEVFPCVALHDTIPFMLASLDGLSEDKSVAVEIKCPGPTNHTLAMQGKVPDHYYCQMQHQLEVTGLDKMMYFSYYGRSGKIIEIKRDDAYIDNLIKGESEFWKCIQDLVAPAATDKDFIQKQDDEWTECAAQWKKYNEQLKESEARENYYRKKLIELSGKSNAMGSGVKLSMSMRKGKVNYCRMPELAGVDVDQYRDSPTIVWRLSECE